MICQNCGAELREDDRFCPSCGTATSNAAAILSDDSEESRFPSWESSTEQEREHKTLVRPYKDQPSGSASERDDYRLMGAYNRSFTTPAIFTLVLYIVLWLPGFIANIVYLREANRIQKLTGEAPDGKGCLVSMLVVLTLFWALVCVIWFGLIAGTIGSGSGA